MGTYPIDKITDEEQEQKIKDFWEKAKPWAMEQLKNDKKHKCYHADGDCIHDNCATCPKLCEDFTE